MRTLLLFFCLAAPLPAAAWSVVVPTSAEAPCVQYDRHAVTVRIAPDASTMTTVIDFRVLEDGPAHLLVSESSLGPATAWLDDSKIAFERLAPAAATRALIDLGLARVRPTLLIAAHRPLARTDRPLAVGRHTLRVEAPLPVDWSAATPHAVIPTRTLGTACHRIPAQVTIEIATDTPLGAAFTPYHDARIERPDSTHAVVHLDGSDVQRNDVHLYLSLADAPIAANLLSWRGQACADGDDAGYLLVAAGPTTTEHTDAVGKDVLFVVDRSGSMEGEKIDQTRRALDSILTALGPDDRFDIISFNGGVRPIFGTLQPVADHTRARAAGVIESLRADGSTNIHLALLTALSELNTGDHARPRVLVFLTDGQATAGEADTDAILRDVAAANELDARLFAFGVGNGVNTRLLDELSLQSGTTARYIRPGADIDATLTDFYRAIQAPVLTQVAIDAAGFAVSDMLPRTLPDLYIGTQLLAAARYQDAAEGRVDVHGTLASGPARFRARGPIYRHGEAHAFLPRLWASRRMAELLYAARQNGGEGPEVDEIRALAWRHGFHTRFTQFRVADDGNVEAGYSNPTDDEVGEEAVGTSSDINSMSRNDNAGGYVDENGAVDMVQVLDRTFVHDHLYWRDTTTPAEPADVIDVRLGSEAWRGLVDAGAGAFLSVGRNVMFQWRCRTVRVTDPDLVEEPPTADRVPQALLDDAPVAEEMTPLPAGLRAGERTGCAATGATDGPWWLALLALGLLWRRRARP